MQHQHFHEARMVVTETAVVYVTAPKSFSGAADYYTVGGPMATSQAGNNHVAGTPLQHSAAAKSTSLAELSSSSTHLPIRSHRPGSLVSSVSGSGAGASASGSKAISVAAFGTATIISAPHLTSVPSSILTDSLIAASGSAPASVKSAANGAPSASLTGFGSSTQADTAKTSSSGLSGGAKAGVAVGVIVAVVLFALLALFCIRRRKNKNTAHEKLEDEKSGADVASNGLVSHVSVRRPQNNAPRLSLRPHTDLFPAMSEKQDGARAGGLLAASNAATAPRSSSPDAANPFGDHAASPTESAKLTDAAADAAVMSPTTAITTPIAAAMPAPLAPRANSPPSGRVSPTLSEGSTRSGSAGPPRDVHRVQLDFKPSMEDELELVAGQLVRMLHEYDDGWALCIRLDRSQQGVVPRTCLSKLPVKPRPAGPPPGMRGPPNGMRGPPPPGMRGTPQGRPRGPSQGQGPSRSYGSMRSNSSYSSNDNRRPGQGRMRSQTATSAGPQRPSSPGPFGSGQYTAGPSSERPRSNSSSSSVTAARRITPPSPLIPADAFNSQTGVPSRKPVPGQAL